jgi:riboflavin synthase alpha subunit
MFTGLIEATGQVERVERHAAGIKVVVATGLAPELTLGESVAINGVCLTVVARDARTLTADISPETARVTTLDELREGTTLNLERSLQVGARLGGHFVLGHVDGIGTVETVVQEGDSHRVTIACPDALRHYLVPKGSIAVDGISLTIASLAGARFDVQIIPFTWRETNLSTLTAGERVNLEYDMLGKYVIRAAALIAQGRSSAPTGAQP